MTPDQIKNAADRAEKHPGGRPTKYSEAYGNELIACMAEGRSVAAFAGRIGVSRSTIYKWAEEYEEFSDAMKVGHAKAADYWEGVLTKIAVDGGGSAAAAIFALKNRASDEWRDKQEHEHTGNLVVNIGEADTKLL